MRSLFFCNRKRKIKYLWKGGLGINNTNEQELENITDNELLKFIVDNGIIDSNTLREEFMKKVREDLLELHEYKIWKGSNNSWYTYLPDSIKGRVLIRKNSEEKIKDIVIEFHRQNNMYIKDVFNEWLDEKLKYDEICKGSYDRYHTDFIRFFSNSKLYLKRFEIITKDDLEEFVKKCIVDYQLTMKTYSGLRILIRGIFKHGKKKKYTQLSISEFFGDLDLSRNIFKRQVKNKEEQVFTEEEIVMIAKYIKKNVTIWNLGVLLAFQTGLRVGELSALEKSDIYDQGIHVQRTETRYKNEQGKCVVSVKEFPKTEAGDRYVVVADSAMSTINEILKINKTGKYLFENNGKRIRESTFNKRIVAICKKLDIKPRSMHKIRKTYGTTLIDGEVDESVIMEQMGHKNIETTKKYYYYSNKNDDKIKSQIDNAMII